MNQIRYDLSDDLCVEVPTAPALFTFTYNGSRAFIVSKGTAPGDVCELARDSVELFVMDSAEPVCGGIFRIVHRGDKGSVVVTHYAAGQLIADHARLENEMDVKRIETAPSQLAVF
jgi:hypothetical protein